MAERILPWREVSALEPVNGGLAGHLATLDTLRSVWERTVQNATPEEFAETRRRSLRRHAIETGIIERLYEVDWGVTEALVAEGLTLEAAEAHGAIDPTILLVIQSQFDALEYLAGIARDTRPLTVQLVRELHQLITRHQATYSATNQFGHKFETELHHGQWKRLPNHVRRDDGSLLQYAPPEQVDQQMGTLIELYRAMDEQHPMVRAAWLHTGSSASTRSRMAMAALHALWCCSTSSKPATPPWSWTERAVPSTSRRWTPPTKTT
jgi:hypothetical protein